MALMKDSGHLRPGSGLETYEWIPTSLSASLHYFNQAAIQVVWFQLYCQGSLVPLIGIVFHTPKIIFTTISQGSFIKMVSWPHLPMPKRPSVLTCLKDGPALCSQPLLLNLSYSSSSLASMHTETEKSERKHRVRLWTIYFPVTPKSFLSYSSLCPQRLE